MRRLYQSGLERLRVKLGRPVVITSSYRSPALNRAVGGSRTSHHHTRARRRSDRAGAGAAGGVSGRHAVTPGGG